MAPNRYFLLVLVRMSVGDVCGARGGGALLKSELFRTPTLIFNKSLTRLNNNLDLAQQQKITSFGLAQQQQ